MRDLIKLGLALAAVVALMVIGFSAVARRVDDTDRRIRSEALEVRVRATDVTLDAFRVRAGQDSTRIAWLQSDIMRLEEEADVAHYSTLEALATLESTRAGVQEDTLAPALRQLLGAERDVAQSYRRELGVAIQARAASDSIVQIESARAEEAVSLLWDVRAERDSALTLLADYRRSIEFSISRLLFRDFPRKAACAGGGAAVAAINKGDVLLGAGVGLAACLVMESIL